MANRWRRFGGIGCTRRSVGCLGGCLIHGQSCQCFLCSLNIGYWSICSFQIVNLLYGSRFVSSHRGRDVFELLDCSVRARFEDSADFQLLGVFEQQLFLSRDLFQRVAVYRLGYRNTGVLHRQPDHGQQIGDDQDHVLCDLGPGDRAHSTKEGAHQNTGQASKNSNLKGQACQACRDQAHAINLRYHIGEGAQNGSKHTNQAWQVAFVAGA